MASRLLAALQAMLQRKEVPMHSEGLQEKLTTSKSFELGARAGKLLTSDDSITKPAVQQVCSGTLSGVDELSRLPPAVLAIHMLPHLTSEELRALKLTCRYLNSALEGVAIHQGLVVCDESLALVRRIQARRQAAQADANEAARSEGANSIVLSSEPPAEHTVTATPPGAHNPHAPRLLSPLLQTLALRPSCLTAAVICATPELLHELLPASLQRLTLERWSLHDQEAQLRAIGQACGASLTSLELRSPLGIQDLPGLMACHGFADMFPALQQVSITHAHRGSSSGCGGHGQPDAVGIFRGITPLVKASADSCFLFRRNTLLGDGQRANDPLLRPLTFVSLPGGGVQSSTAAWSLRTGREWGSWHRDQARAQPATTAAAAMPELSPPPNLQSKHPQQAQQQAAPQPPPHLIGLRLHGVELRGATGLSKALMLLRSQLVSLELASLWIAEWDDALGREISTSECGMQLLAQVVPELVRLKQLRVKWPKDTWNSYNAAGLLVDAVVCHFEACVRSGAGTGVELLELLSFGLELSCWQKLVCSRGGIKELEVDHVVKYDGSIPAQLRRLVMHNVMLDDINATSQMQTWGAATGLQRVDIGLFMKDDYFSARGDLPKALLLEHAELQLSRLRCYCTALARVPHVALRLSAYQRAGTGGVRPLRPTWNELLSTLEQIAGLKALILMPESGMFDARDLMAVAVKHHGLQLLALERLGAEYERVYGRQLPCCTTLRDKDLGVLLQLPALQGLVLNFQTEGCKITDEGLKQLEVAYKRRHGRLLLTLLDS